MVDIPETLPLSIFTAGVEVDNCGRISLARSGIPPPVQIAGILNQPEQTWVRSARGGGGGGGGGGG